MYRKEHKKMKKKILLSFMLVCISIFAFGALSVSAAYSGTQYGDYLYYTVSNGEVTITDCDENATGEIVIPETIRNYPVTGIGYDAFRNCESLTEVIIPDSVTSIGNHAFSYCSNLTDLTLPNSVTSIDNSAFYSTYKIENLYITDLAAYLNCKYSDVYSHPNAKNIYINNEKSTNIVVPDSVTTIPDYAFCGCESLISVTISDRVTRIGENAFTNCKNLTSATIPDSVTNIGYYAFANCSSIVNIKIPNKITYIPSDLFYGCSGLKNITIPDSVIEISGSAFRYCKELENITLPNSIKRISYYAFDRCDSLAYIYYNGTEEQWNKLNIDNSGNDNLEKATKVYFAYINLFDKDEKEISSKTQNMGKTVDTSAIILSGSSILKLYKDKELTQEYSLDTPISENLTLYADVIEVNKLKISGVQKADIGQNNILQPVTFATDKTAKYLICTIKYPEDLKLTEISAKDFYVDEDMRETVDGYTYSYLTCTYKENGNMPVNQTLNPFDLIFDISENAQANTALKIEISEDAVLSDDNGNNYTFDTITNNEIKINPILIKEMSVIGADEIDEAATYTVLFTPENATNKAVKWSVDDETIAAVSENGTLTPIKSGTVVLKATATDGSGVYAEKTINVKVYAKISLITANTGIWNTEFSPETNEYIIYVPKNTTSIKLTAKHSGALKSSDGKTFVSNVAKPISVKDDETDITLTYSCTGYTDSVYTVKIIKFEGTKTSVSEDGKTFDVKPVNVAVGSTVILALYDNGNFVEMKSEKYNGADIQFTTDNAYTNAKVMVWESLFNMKPVCEAEIVK